METKGEKEGSRGRTNEQLLNGRGNKEDKKYKANRKSAAEGKGPQDGQEEAGSSVQRK